MAGIINGRLTASSKGREPIRFTVLPTLIKYLLLEVPSENKGDVYIGGATVASNNAPAIAKGTTREFTFRHEGKETPGDLSNLNVNFEHNGDVINYLAITVQEVVMAKGKGTYGSKKKGTKKGKGK